jgi:cell wall-associated NlpC family hydrolase
MSHRTYRRIRRRGRGQVPPGAIAAVVAGVVLAAAVHATAGARPAAGGAPGKAAAAAIAYARAQLGKPYLWGGTGPDAFDCSGLAMMAYRAAGISIARTTFSQWETEGHVSDPEPGDLAFFAGSDGTMTSPGHVGIVIGGGKMIQALGAGYPVMVSTWHRPDLVGFSQPWGGAS